MTILAFAPEHNTRGKRDATGAFHPEARRFLDVWREPSSSLHLVDCRGTMARRREQVLEVLEEHGGELECLALFCHGWKDGVQLGFRTRDIHELAHELAYTARKDISVVLYACSTAGTRQRGAPGGDGGFADELRDGLCAEGLVACQVDAHSTLGHTTRNPYVRRFEGRGNPFGGVGGHFIVPPGTKRWTKWKRLLREDEEARYALPFWSDQFFFELLDGMR